jgi:hypothetical protein
MRAQLIFPLGILLVSLLPPIVTGGQKPPAPIPNSAKGFDKQYKELFKAWERANNKARKKENEEESRARFLVFAIPEHWFNDVLGLAEGPKVAKQYLDLFKAFELSTEREFFSLSGENTAQVKTKFRGSHVNPPGSVMSSLISLPSVQLFRLQHFTAPRSTFCADCTPGYYGRLYNFFYAESFIYIDGAFRFVGSCDCPFWSACSTSDPVMEGQLVRHVQSVNSNNFETLNQRSNR